jgi:hypothetical protein
MSAANVPLADAKPGVVYLVRSRNLRVAVYAGARKFIGIRTKFEARVLSAEWHVDIGPPLGTLRIERAVGVISEAIPLVEGLGAKCQRCGAPVEWSGPPAPAPWVHTSQTTCSEASPIAVSNRALFKALEALELEALGN